MFGNKHIFTGKSVNGFSFARLGFLTSAADEAFNAVYALILLEILRTSFGVSIYSTCFAVFCMLFSIFTNIIFRRFSKATIFSFALLILGIIGIVMGLSTHFLIFAGYNFIFGAMQILVSLSLPLFIADFLGDVGMPRLNSRYHLWLNLPAFCIPMVALFIASKFGNGAATILAGLIYLASWLVFKSFKIAPQDRQKKLIHSHKFRTNLWSNIIAFFKHPGLPRAYFVNLGYNILGAMRVLYIPILVIENGFSEKVLGLVLGLSALPSLISCAVMGKLVDKFGKKIWLILGLSSSAAFSFLALFIKGTPMLVIFVLWSISGALISPINDLLFFDVAKNSEQGKFYGIFRSSGYLSDILAPAIAAVCIAIFGTTSSVWIVTLIAGLASTALLISEK